MLKKILIFVILTYYVASAVSQESIQQCIEDRGETVVSIDAIHLKEIPNIKRWSIDNITQGRATLYINRSQYHILKSIDIPLTKEPTPSLKSNIKMINRNAKTDNEWNSYPDYPAYLAIMQKFVTDYPNKCRLDTIGYSVNGRLLLALVISNNIEEIDSKPNFFYTSSMHGDELTGYVLMLHLADYILQNTDSENIAEIIKGANIYINPLANPDGTFKTGDETVSGATRFNANNVDLNRNFPDIEDGEHPDGNEWQPETLAMMSYMKKHRFNMSMNFHGGAEVLNYPWDTFGVRHADDAWFRFVSREYADTVHTIDTGYMTDLDNGITNGYDWYSISGGRQDYITYFLQGREITAELSEVKLVDADELPGFWDRNYKSLLNYTKQVLYGIHGIVTDKSDNPIKAKITIKNYDTNNSYVVADDDGVFYRFLPQGIYSITASADGYAPKTVSVTVENYKQTDVSIQLDTISSVDSRNIVSSILYPNPVESIVTFENDYYFLNGDIEFRITALDGRIVWKYYCKDRNKQSVFNLSFLPTGIYIFTAQNSNNVFTQKIIKQ
jgi:hypothetical protein